MIKLLRLAVLSILLLSFGAIIAFAQSQDLLKDKTLDEPVVVNGDTVEYSTDQKTVSASGDVVITYGKSKLTCRDIVVNTQTKEAKAQGNVVIEDERGILEGEEILYNFRTQTGTITKGRFISYPYYGLAQRIERIADKELLAYKSTISTCSFDRPHAYVSSRKVHIVRGDKIETYGDILHIGNIPLFYIPYYKHSLKGPLMHVQFSPGYSKKWGAYLLSAWRYSLADTVEGRIYADYRDHLGFAGGFGANYGSENFGRGDLKVYHTKEDDQLIKEPNKSEFERYLIRLRHSWQIDDNTLFTSEYYKIHDDKRVQLGGDNNMLKDYFYREYELDVQPKSYALVHHNFNYSSMDILAEKRVNNWYNPGYVEKLPEVEYSLPSFDLADTGFYFDNVSSAGYYNKINSTALLPNASNVHANRMDTTNKLTTPVRVSFINLAPFVGTRETFYDHDLRAEEKVRTIFLTGVDASTKFYRIFDINSDLAGIKVNSLRHIITPTVEYAYDHQPTITADHLRQIDEMDNITYSNNRAALELTNTLQTKRDNQTVDLAVLKLNSTYWFKPKTGPGSYLGDYLYDLELKPYSWMRIGSDGTYNHRYDYFSAVNYDLTCDLAKERSLGLGQRYQRKGTNEITFNSDWRLTPKWKFGLYQRYNVKETPTVTSGFTEQEYRFTRDLHCWIMDIAYTVEKHEGHTIWFVFRLKAFPETQFRFEQSYHSPRSGAQ